MKKNLVNWLLAAMVVAGVFVVEYNEFMSLAFLGVAASVIAIRDLRPNRVKGYTVDELLDYETGKCYE